MLLLSGLLKNECKDTGVSPKGMVLSQTVVNPINLSVYCRLERLLNCLMFIQSNYRKFFLYSIFQI